MSIAKLRLDESTKIEFGVAITGASGEPEVRLVIEGKRFDVSCPCAMTDNGVEATIVELKNVLPAGTYPVKLEVVVENKLYVPFEDTITLEPAVEVVSRPHVNPAPVKESVTFSGIVVTPIAQKKPVVLEDNNISAPSEPVNKQDHAKQMLDYVQRFIDMGTVSNTRIKKKVEYAYNAGKFGDATRADLDQAFSLIDQKV